MEESYYLKQHILHTYFVVGQIIERIKGEKGTLFSLEGEQYSTDSVLNTSNQAEPLEKVIHIENKNENEAVNIRNTTQQETERVSVT